MKKVFADTNYWVAKLSPNDPLAKIAKDAESKMGQVILVTSDEVLVEFITYFRGFGEHWRGQVVSSVKKILEHPNIKVIPQTRDSFLKGIKLYEERQDKKYSLIDCISMNIMIEKNISEILTNDHHFEQEDFIILMCGSHY